MHPTRRQVIRSLVATAGVGLTCACASTAAMSSRPAPFPLARTSGSASNVTTVPIEPIAESARPIDRVGVPLNVAIVESALSLRGTAYRFGGTTPDSGFDCSGFVAYVLAMHAVAVPRLVSDQFAAGRSVQRDQVRAGDLVFFSTTGPGPTHVGIVTNEERAEFVHAPADGSVVRIDRFDAAYWRTRWVGARRLMQD